ncbi:MAG: class I SAM-dependent methyltransferase [Alphaproteobacteria bacterium]|nr:class I SAM-dependent methyltransferase [Alphaproteobacteria bacterium]
MDHDLIRRLYGKGARVYDAVFGPLLDRGRRMAVDAVNASDAGSVLEVGVGTGRSLPHYRADLDVTGIDLSPEMLARARARGAGLPQVRALLEMDAQNMSFPDAHFGAVVAMYVATVVPDMARLFDELKRVCVPGGLVLVVNHIAAEAGVVAAFDRLVAPATRAVALRSDLRLSALVATAGLEPVGVDDAGIGGYIKLIRFRND